VERIVPFKLLFLLHPPFQSFHFLDPVILQLYAFSFTVYLSFISIAFSFFSVMIHPEILIATKAKLNPLPSLPSLPHAVQAGLLLRRAEAEQKANCRRPSRPSRTARSASQEWKLH